MNIEVTANDFNHLTTNSMQGGDQWVEQQGRFEMANEYASSHVPITTTPYIHWVDTYGDAMLCRAYLDFNKQDCVIGWDLVSNEYVICTNYPGPFRDKK